MKYVALLRGINVGGNNIISMSTLKNAFVNAGFIDAQTYINSGNVIFTPNNAATGSELKRECEKIIFAATGLQITVTVISEKELAAALAAAPAWWDADKESKHNAIFVIEPLSALGALESVGQSVEEYEKTASCGTVIFWSAPIKTFSHTRWSRITKSHSIYAHITIRNANTAKTLLRLMQG